MVTSALVGGNYLDCGIRSVLEAHIGTFSSTAKFKLTHFLSFRLFCEFFIRA